MATGRTPNYIVFGLVMVTCLLAAFYISSSAKAREFKRVLDRFEERMRAVKTNLIQEKNIETNYCDIF